MVSLTQFNCYSIKCKNSGMGKFTNYNGTTCNRIIRLNNDVTIDL
jgi:hypothetical protein